jgi:mRNA interferase RelE/StbE
MPPGEPAKPSPKIYTVLLSPAAQKALKTLARGDRAIAKAIGDEIDKLAENPRPVGCVKLSDRRDWRISVRQWRVIYDVYDDRIVVEVTKVRKRDESTYRD